jgi:hypothetical protein
VVTIPFAHKVRLEAQTLGMGTVAHVVLPHTFENSVPIGLVPKDVVMTLVEAVVPEIDFVLSASADEVSKAYDSSTAPRTMF